MTQKVRAKRGEFTFERRPAQTKIARILEMLSEEALTMPEIADRVGLTKEGLYQYMRHLRETKQIYIASWTRQSVLGEREFPRARYRVGNKPDRPKPRPKTDAEVARDHRKRMLAKPDEYVSSYRRYRANMAKLELKARTARRKQLIEAGFDPTAVQLSGMRVILTGNRRTPSPAQVEEIITLREQGLLWKEVSALTGIPKSTCRTHYLRAKGEL